MYLLRRQERTTGHPPRLLPFLILLFLLLPSPALATGEDIYARLVLNRQEKGEFLVRRDAAGFFFVREADWKALGLAGNPPSVAGTDGESFIALSDLQGITVAFDESTVTLELGAEPSSFPFHVKSLHLPMQRNVLRPDDNSAFLNYGLVRTGGTGADTTSLPNEIGVRRGGWLFLNAGSFDSGSSQSGYRRFSTSATRDDREALTRLVIGDASASSGDLGSTFPLAGVSFTKEYRMNPAVERFPSASIRGSTRYPADAILYVDNVQVSVERIPSGPFEIRDLSYYGGAGEVRLVLKDPFGREEEIRTPFYFTDTVLKEGLHDYAYQGGVARAGNGNGDGGYSDAALSFFHRYGVTDEVTLGVRGEECGSRFNLGGTAVGKPGWGGLAGGALAVGSNGEGTGVAALISYGYQNRRLAFRSSVEMRSSGYGTAQELPGVGTRSRVSAGGGYVSPGVGSLSLDWYSFTRYGGGGDQSGFSITFSRSFRNRWSLQGGYRYQKVLTGQGEFSLFATYPLGTDRHASARVAAGSDGNRQEAELRKNAPLGEGYGYGAHLDRTSRSGGDSWTAAPSGLYNGRYAVFAGDLSSTSGPASGTSYRAAVSGSVLHLGGEVAFSRPVTDSFGVVSLGALPGVGVLQNGQPIGRTDERGRILLPNLNSYYENQVGLDDKDLPMEYKVGEITRYVSPPFRSGSIIPFDVTRLQAITGYLDIIRNGKTLPAEYVEVNIEGAKEPVPTGRGGEFYIENLPPGEHAGRLEADGRIYGFRLVVPDSKEFIVELGRVACEALP